MWTDECVFLFQACADNGLAAVGGRPRVGAPWPVLTHPHLPVGAAGHCNGDTDAAGASGTASTEELCDGAPSGATEGRATTGESVWSRKTIACQ